ncbi:hypothetical protein FHY19_001338 [Xanthomonas arboricola]|nr:hypothetical protein [Xanthomonas sp. 4461]
MPVSAVADAAMQAPAVRCGAVQWGQQRLRCGRAERDRRCGPQV